ncbi:MAG: hypothetical protein IID32_13035, partial [Planctomycetes bacterium]|nr:hypothetical protein [Planctomycetota bacterium]
LGLGVGSGGGAWGTGFNYKGELKDGGVVVDGVYDFAFMVFDDAVAGTQKGGTVNEEDVAVAEGRFTVKLDFGSGVFDGDERWLEIGVRAGALADPNVYVTLTPRHELTATPYAIHALNSHWSKSGNDIYNNNSGNVGVGTNSPATSLEIQDGSIYLDASAIDKMGGLYFQTKAFGGSPGTHHMLIKADADVTLDESISVFHRNAAPVNIPSDSGRVVRIAYHGGMAIGSTMSGTPTLPFEGLLVEGEVKIGGTPTDNPNAQLQVVGDGSGTVLRLTNGGGTGATNTAIIVGEALGASRAASFYGITSKELMLVHNDGTGGAAKFIGDVTVSNGNVGIGDSTPSQKLTINGSIGFNNGTAPMMYIYESGSANARRRVISHSLGFPEWGLKYNDAGTGGYPGDAFEIGSSNASPRYSHQVASGITRWYSSDGDNTVTIDNNLNSGGSVSLTNSVGVQTLRLLGEDGSGSGACIEGYNDSGNKTYELDSAGGGGQSFMYLYDGSGSTTTNRILLQAIPSGGGYISLTNNTGSTTITLDGDVSGDGRITTQELVITGGSDLSEQFDVADSAVAPKAGILVCIDPLNPGKLVVSGGAYDKKVAGVISGAGGVKPGMMMSHSGTLADGEYPVALTGRAYAYCDVSNGPIEPGDLLTTSATAGHAMKVTDYAKAQGAVIGKAM